MTVICIGPFCIPLYSVIPFLFLVLRQLWQWIVAKMYPDKLKKKNEDNNKKEPEKIIASKPLSSKFRKRNVEGKIIHVQSMEQWESIHNDASKSGKFVVVKFTAKWCRPCKEISPVYQELCSSNQHLLFLEVDIDDLEEISEECRIIAMPTFQVFQDKKKVKELTGAKENELKKLIEYYASN